MSDLPAEGSVDRPYAEAPYVEWLRSVNWSGGFMVGVNLSVEGPDGNTTNTILLHGAKSWTEAKTLSGARTIYDNRAGAYGNPPTGTDASGNPIKTPTFLLGGQTTVFGGTYPGFLYTAWIETTTDGGKTWTRSYEADQSFVVAIVYDKTDKVFYAQATANATGGDDYVWQVLKSADGLSWDVVETTPGGPGAGSYASPIMTEASDPIYQDGNGNNCPGGVYGYDEAHKILMAPYPDIVPFAYERRFGAPQVQIRTENQAGHRSYTYIDIPGMDTIVSVAFSGGMWQAAGSGEGAQIATSTDDGDTWTTTYSEGPVGSSAMIVLGAVSEPPPVTEPPG